MVTCLGDWLIRGWRRLMAETTVHLKTSGMHCRSCSMLVEMTLDELDGVSEAKSDHASGDTIVTFDSDSVTVDQMIAVIREAGYDAETVQ